MLILLLVIAIIGVVICLIVGYKNRNDISFDDENWILFLFVLCFLAIVFFGSFFAVLVSYINDSYADERIEIVRTKNTEIEKEIQVAVKSYLEHEGKTYSDMTSDEALAVAVAYPELASNELVKEQIATYKSNREQVLQYEQQKIDKKVKAWWLWFGSE